MQNQSTVKIKEIFTSIQGEGTYVGEKQTFVRFCKCNLACKYCDTDFSAGVEYSSFDLAQKLKQETAQTISFTGGEPLCEKEFLKKFLSQYKKELNKKIYLETNGTLFEELKEIIEFVDVVSMDIKLKSATGQENRFLDNEKFLEIASKKETFLKIVFDENIKNEEIDEVIKIAKKYNSLIVLQPKMPINSEIELDKIFDLFYQKYQNIRLIPQTHKFLNLA